MTHITQVLHQEHEKVSELLGELKNTTDGLKTRSALCQQIKHELMAHAQFEEEIFYPALREGSPEAAPEVDSALEEHEQAEQMLDEIEQLEPTSTEFKNAIGRLEKAILEHVEHEESRIFPIAEKLLNDTDAQQMAREHDQMVKQYKERVGA